MKKFISLFLIIVFFAVSLSAQDSKKATGANKDAGTVTADGYTNETYQVKFKLPEGTTWKIVKEEQALLKINGKVAEFWSSLDKNIRVIISIEDTGNKVIDIAQRNQSELINVYNKIKVIDDKNWFTKGPNKVYLQTLETESMVGEKYKVVNYVVMRKENPYNKINLFVIYPLAIYFENRVMIEQIYRNLEVK